jgi:16S rRNA (cytosine967-C5)-methyltransferase
VPDPADFAPPLAQEFVQAAQRIYRILFAPPGKAPTTSPHPAVMDLVYRGLKHWGLTQVRIARLAPSPPAPLVLALLSVAWAALEEQRRPAHTVVDEAVAAAKALVPSSAKKISGFVNALLRKTLADVRSSQADWTHPVARWNAPPWWIEKIQLQYGERSEEILSGLTARAPLTIRLLDAAPMSRAEFLAQLGTLGRVGTPVGPHAVIIDPPMPVEEIPGFSEGWVSVQDAAAQRVVDAFSPQLFNSSKTHAMADRPALILDACAAPGGKSIALAQHHRATVWAVDVSAHRLARLRRDLVRVGSTLRGSVQTAVADLLDPAALARAGLPASFDAVLLDAPCSASGVVRRHPEIPWKRTPEALATVVHTQQQLLDTLWGRVRPGGELVFVTCSIFLEEGEAQQQAFLERTPDARLMPSPGRLLPTAATEQGQNHDGFFYARFNKQS